MYRGVFGRKDRLVREKRHDVYRPEKKLPEPSVCRDCGVVYADGRWSWADRPKGAALVSCPACQRKADNVPAGVITLSGTFLDEHREEVIGLIRNVESLEKGERPLQRIMDLAYSGSRLTVRTTGVHVARRIGDALARSYQGKLDFTYGDGEKSIQISWRRDDEPAVQR